MSIADNLLRVRERIAAAAESAGRSAEEITLVGVTKYVSTSEAAELVAAGCMDLAESRPQELWNKFEAFQRAGASPPPSAQPENSSPVCWHLIGHLQRNKVQRTLPLVSLIHSVDSERLLAAIDAANVASNSGSPAKVLLEVNTSGESAKHGLGPDDVEPLLATAPQYPHVAIRGLMTMAALNGGPEIAAQNFKALRELRDRLKCNAPDHVTLNELSIGMSNDFEVAIREGATLVRVGSLLWEKI